MQNPTLFSMGRDHSNHHAKSYVKNPNGIGVGAKLSVKISHIHKVPPERATHILPLFVL